MNPQVICPGIITQTATCWEGYIPSGLRRIWKKGTLHTFSGAHAQDFIYILSGMLAINFYDSYGKYRCQLFCGPNCLANEANLITDLRFEGSTYYCNLDCEIVYFDGKWVQSSLLRKSPHLLMNIAFSQAIKSMHAQALLNAMIVRTRLQQVCWYISRLRAYHGDKDSFEPQISQQQLASLLGQNERTFKRHIVWLKDQGVLGAFTKKRMVVTNPQLLEELAQPSAS